MSATTYTERQRMAALQKANVRRIRIAKVRTEIRMVSMQEGCALVADILENPDQDMGAFPVGRLLLAIRKVGVMRASLWCTTVGVRSLDRAVRDLSERQRMMLAQALRRYAETHE